MKGLKKLYNLNAVLEKNDAKVKQLFSNDDEYLIWLNWLESEKEKEQLQYYGDYQTPLPLIEQVYKIIDSKKISFDNIFEPTVGRGNFLIGALKKYNHLKNVTGVEIQRYYINELKQRLITEELLDKANIRIRHESFFDCDLTKYLTPETLVVGNPPWVTNSGLSVLDSNNLPSKSNFKNHKGLDALTGKSNFDISEFILLRLIDEMDLSLNNEEGNIALLVKNIVAINILKEIKNKNWNVTTFEVYNFNAKKEFNVSTEACDKVHIIV